MNPVPKDQAFGAGIINRGIQMIYREQGSASIYFWTACSF
jgi:hypothetical protein